MMKNASLHGIHTRILSPTFPIQCTMRLIPQKGCPVLLIGSCSEYPSENTAEFSLLLLWGWSLQLSWTSYLGQAYTLHTTEEDLFSFRKQLCRVRIPMNTKGQHSFHTTQMAGSAPFQFAERKKHGVFFRREENIGGLADLTLCRHFLLFY